MNKQLKCPQCKTDVEWHGNASRPFCSERCRLIDLGCWSDEAYRVAGAKQDFVEDNIIPINFKK